MIRQVFRTQVRSLGDDQAEVILSTGAPARDGHILVPGGCDLSGFRKNPIVLFQHNPDFPVGTASNLALFPDKITARITFAPLGISATADTTRGLVKAGIVSAVSVGFDPQDGEPLDPKRPHGGQRFTKWELLECSFVSVPADTGAVVTARAFRSESGRAETLLASATRDLGISIEHHAAIGRCLDRGNVAAAKPPWRAAFDSVRAACRALDEAAPLPPPGSRAATLVERAASHTTAARAHHRRLGIAIDAGRADDAEAPHRLFGRSLRAAKRALDELAQPAAMLEDGAMGKLADPDHEGTSKTLADVGLDPHHSHRPTEPAALGRWLAENAAARARATIFAPPVRGSFAERQAEKNQLAR